MLCADQDPGAYCSSNSPRQPEVSGHHSPLHELGTTPLSVKQLMSATGSTSQGLVSGAPALASAVQGTGSFAPAISGEKRGGTAPPTPFPPVVCACWVMAGPRDRTCE